MDDQPIQLGRQKLKKQRKCILDTALKSWTDPFALTGGRLSSEIFGPFIEIKYKTMPALKLLWRETTQQILPSLLSKWIEFIVQHPKEYQRTIIRIEDEKWNEQNKWSLLYNIWKNTEGQSFVLKTKHPKEYQRTIVCIEDRMEWPVSKGLLSCNNN